MNADLRAQLRDAIDQRVRQLAFDGIPSCAGCGSDMEALTAGCRTCKHRKAQRVKRRRAMQALREYRSARRTAA
jgi:hypothetical protein